MSFLPPGVTTGAELLEHYKRVRARLPPPVKQPPKVVKRPPPPPPPPTPPAEPAAPVYKRPAGTPMAHYREAIFHIVGLRYAEIPRDVICGPSRVAPIVQARVAISWLSHEVAKASLLQIGRWMGGKDHSSVYNHLRVVRSRMQRDPLFAIEMQVMASEVRRLCDGAST